METHQRLHHSEEYEAFIRRDGLKEVSSIITPEVIQKIKDSKEEYNKADTKSTIILIVSTLGTPILACIIYCLICSNFNELICYFIMFITLMIGWFIGEQFEKKILSGKEIYSVDADDVLMHSLFPNGYKEDRNTFLDNVVLNTFALAESEKYKNEAQVMNNGLYTCGDWYKDGKVDRRVAVAYNLGDRNNTQIAMVNYGVFVGISLKCNFNTSGRWLKVVQKDERYLQADEEYRVNTEDVFITENYNIYSNDAVWARKILTADVLTILWTWIDYQKGEDARHGISIVAADNELAVSWYNGERSLKGTKYENLESIEYTDYKYKYNHTRENINRVYELADLMVCNQ